MNRSSSVLFCCLICAGAAFSWAGDPDEQPEPPVRMKKRDQPSKPHDQVPPASDPAPKPPAKEKEEPTKEPVRGEEAEIIERLNKSMRTVEERLAKKDPGEGTLQLQKDIVNDLDALIRQQQKRQQQQQQQPNQEKKQDPSKSRPKQQGNETSASKEPQRKPEPDKPAGIPSPDPKKDPKEGQAGKDQQDSMNKMADVYKDIWGHLPETRRQEMDAYARERFMAKYQDLLKQYYTTISEKGRRNGG